MFKKTHIKLGIALVLALTVSSFNAGARGFGAGPGIRNPHNGILRYGNTPFRRVCLALSGQPWDINLGTDQVELCRFGIGGVSSIGFESFKEQGTTNNAIAAFQAGNQSCDAAGGDTVDTTDLDGGFVEVCLFGDGSLIETNVLSAGPDSDQGAALQRALNQPLDAAPLNSDGDANNDNNGNDTDS